MSQQTTQPSLVLDVIECYVKKLSNDRIPPNPTIREIRKDFEETKRDGLIHINPEINFDDIRIVNVRLIDMDDEYWIFEVEFYY